jgi:chloride channel protein, CIC family
MGAYDPRYLTAAIKRVLDRRNLPNRIDAPRSLSLLRRRLRTSEMWFIALAVVVGGAAGLLSVLQNDIANALQDFLYQANGERIDALPHVPFSSLIWLPIGGVVLGMIAWQVQRSRTRPLIDVVEANALYGGALSVRDSIIVCTQTLLSNGFGGSVGLEAAYAQSGGAVASAIGQGLKLRRQDLRTLLGAGAGAAIGAAFGAPLTGAFYAFEIVIGSYAPSMIAPVAAACLASVLVATGMGSAPYSLHVHVMQPPGAWDYLIFAGLGLICALVGIAVMRLTASVETLVQKTGLPVWIRPFCGGVILAVLGFIQPQILSSGHGALTQDLAGKFALNALASIFILKACASIVSLGFGFRGGLFFASLLLGALLGQMYVDGLVMMGAPLAMQRDTAALVGMGSLGVAIVGGPLTMSFLVLESTRDFGVSAATLAASLIGSTIVRERFGYSFSTWRLHLRGETIRSARDVGWVRTLTAGRMMRTNVSTIAASSTLAEFRRRFPLGSRTCVVVLDEAQRYAGIVLTANAWRGERDDTEQVGSVAASAGFTLSPQNNIEDVMRMFDQAEAEELVVVDGTGHPLGTLSQVYVARRYARELEDVHNSLFGERR